MSMWVALGFVSMGFAAFFHGWSAVLLIRNFIDKARNPPRYRSFEEALRDLPQKPFVLFAVGQIIYWTYVGLIRPLGVD